MNENPAARNKDIVVQHLDGEILVYDLVINKAYCLNETSAAIWEMCDGKTSVAELSRKLSEKLKKPVGEDLIWLAIDQFKKDGLLADAGDQTLRFDGLSRRAVIRRIGLSSLVALPVIMSLVAPTAAQAQSKGACVGAGTFPTGQTFSVCYQNVPGACAAVCAGFGSFCCSGNAAVGSCTPTGVPGQQSCPCVCSA